MKDQLRNIAGLDVAILAAVAICGGFTVFAADREFPVSREWYSSMARRAGGPAVAGPSASFVKFETFASRAIQDLEAALYAISPGLAVIAYRPRRGVRAGRRGPGQVALAIAGGSILLGLASYYWSTYGPPILTGYTTKPPTSPPPFYWTHLPRGQGVIITYGILSGWAYLAVIRGWSRTNRPLERAGRWIGLAWIVASVLAWGIVLMKQR